MRPGRYVFKARLFDLSRPFADVIARFGLMSGIVASDSKGPVPDVSRRSKARRQEDRP
jgi:hypothetical protein